MADLQIESVRTICAKNSIVSLTGVAEYVNEGVAVGIGIKNKRPKILINLHSAIHSGADFSSELLNLAQVL
jgi:hypothetical protein